MDFKIITELEKAKDAWDFLSPHKTIDDEWDFRHTFLKHLPYQLFFIVGEINGIPELLLPLQKNNLEGLMPPYYPNDGKAFLEFFGGDDIDDNSILGTQDNSVFEFVRSQRLPAYLAPLNPSFETISSAKFYENKFYLDFKDYKTHDDLLSHKWSSDSRKKMRQQLRKLHREHNIEIIVNNYDDIDLVEKLNIQRFGDESSFRYPYRKQIFHDLAKLYDVLTLTIVVDSNKEAVSYGIIYKNIYIGMNAGINNTIPDLPKLLVMTQIDKAIELGCTAYDAGKGDGGWKESYKFDKKPQYKIEINKD